MLRAFSRLQPSFIPRIFSPEWKGQRGAGEPAQPLQISQGLSALPKPLHLIFFNYSLLLQDSFFFFPPFQGEQERQPQLGRLHSAGLIHHCPPAEWEAEGQPEKPERYKPL